FRAGADDAGLLAPLGQLLESTENDLPLRIDGGFAVSYAAQFELEFRKPAPETRLAKLWHERLGANAIPIDAGSREQLVSRGIEHTDLRRHILAWKSLKEKRSPWASLGT